MNRQQLWEEHFESTVRKVHVAVPDLEAVRDAAVKVFSRMDTGEIQWDPTRAPLEVFLWRCVKNAAMDIKPHRLLCETDMGKGCPQSEEEGEEGTVFERLVNQTATQSTPEEMYAAVQTLEQLERKLDARCAAVIRMKAAGFDADEIGASLELTPEQVHKAVTKARHIARQCVSQESGT